MLYSKPSWTPSYTLITNFLRISIKIIGNNIEALKILFGIEIPSWFPTLPEGIKSVEICNKSVNGEWVYSTDVVNIRKYDRYILYIHGGGSV